MRTYNANTGRLEREMITASMPSLQYPSVSGTGDQDGTLPPSTGIQDAPPRVILPLLPHISREPTHREFSADSYKADLGCMYCPGDVLCSNSAIVIARLAEIKQAGTGPADLRTREFHHLSDSSRANPNGGVESENNSSGSSNENGLSPVDVEVVARGGGVEALGKEESRETEEAWDSPDTTGKASDQSGRRQPHPAGPWPPIETMPNWAESSGVMPPGSRRW